MAMLFTKAILARLKAQSEAQKRHPDKDGIDFMPVVKVFTPDANCTWYFSELNTDTMTLFGLCDLGLGSVEYGCVSMEELFTVRGKFGLPVERDRHFKFEKSIRQYWEEAQEKGGL